ncbi:hypothetical protein [Acinetobacter courvalinii]|uniref:DUF4435 domain-containing protein n=1 Tax=Acinetobacter courvalinii TaxID=280147 RepID=A0AA42LDW5_9GAMM|nr:hypothetical protein [Acinetobacter courvalinii]MDH0562882.1 hypothetical protein [Acinetobacter courvalinii]
MSDIAFTQSSKYIKKSQLFNGKLVVKVLFENIQDSNVWKDSLPIKENVTFKYATAVDVADDLKLKRREGCSQLKKISHYELGKNLIICIDSDYNYIGSIMRSIINNTDFNYFIYDYVFETIVNSKENLIYYEQYVVEHMASLIYSHASDMKDKAPWIFDFYAKFSNLIFKHLLQLIYHDVILHQDLKINQKGFKVFWNKINKILDIPSNKKVNFSQFFQSRIWKDIELEVEKLEKEMEIIFLNHNRKIEFELILSKIKNFNINEKTIYNFFMGHNLESLLKNILVKYFDIIYEDEICFKCVDLPSENSRVRRRELENSKIYQETSLYRRNLGEHEFFSQTFERLKNLY